MKGLRRIVTMGKRLWAEKRVEVGFPTRSAQIVASLFTSVRLPFAKMLSSLNAFEISNIQKQKTEYLNHAIGM
jgi:hypothetical protein